MAKASALTGGTGEIIHTRTTSDSVESQVAVLGVDGSDAVVAVTNESVNGSEHGLVVRPIDEYTDGEVLAEQTGAASVLTFTFANAVQLVVVDADGASSDVARADPFGGTPTATLGIPCRDETPAYIPVTATTVAVYAPTGMAVTVWGLRR